MKELIRLKHEIGYAIDLLVIISWFEASLSSSTLHSMYLLERNGIIKNNSQKEYERFLESITPDDSNDLSAIGIVYVGTTGDVEGILPEHVKNISNHWNW